MARSNSGIRTTAKHIDPCLQKILNKLNRHVVRLKDDITKLMEDTSLANNIEKLRKDNVEICKGLLSVIDDVDRSS